VDGFVGSHDRYSILVQFNTVVFAIGTDDLGVYNEGQAFEFAV
jgi:hypothetical protein